MVAVVRRFSPGLLERFVMGTSRDRFIRHPIMASETCGLLPTSSSTGQPRQSQQLRSWLRHDRWTRSDRRLTLLRAAALLCLSTSSVIPKSGAPIASGSRK